MSEEFSYSALPSDSVSLSRLQETPKPPQYAVKRKKILFILAIIQCFLAGVILTLGLVCISIIAGPRYHYCDMNGCVFVSLLSFLSGVFGMVASKRTKARCLMVTYFIFCILATVPNVLVMSTGYSNAVYRPEAGFRNETAHMGAQNGTEYGESDASGDQTKTKPDNKTTLLMLSMMMLISAIVNFICCNIGSGLICAIWSKTGCCGTNHSPTVVYVQSGKT